MSSALDRLMAIMARLRDPERGCPWDREQNFATIAPYTIEEAYEVADAITRGDSAALKDELGDLLFQVVFHARMAEEAGLFSFADVAAAIADKMVRRHPHVFGDAVIDSAAAQSLAWEEHKARERALGAASSAIPASVLDGVALALPALLRAAKIQNRAARIGFDWPEARPAIAKLAEEIAELEVEIAGGAAHARVEEEMGDILFAAANLARKLDIDPEAALRAATAKFERRFRRVETLAAERGIAADLAALDALWDEVKRAEREHEPTSAAQGASPSKPQAAASHQSGLAGPDRAVCIKPVVDALPASFAALQAEAHAAGYHMLDRVAAEWQSEQMRFDGTGEALLAAYCDNRLIGIGGITRDPGLCGVLRMRRFYVAEQFRRRGAARALALALLERAAAAGQAVVVNAAIGSEPFWEALGFTQDRRHGHTHAMPAAQK